MISLELKEPVGQIVCTDKGILAVEQNKVLLPPSWNKTFAWGYADLSCRLGTYESDKVCPTSLQCCLVMVCSAWLNRSRENPEQALSAASLGAKRRTPCFRQDRAGRALLRLPEQAVWKFVKWVLMAPPTTPRILLRS